MVGLKNVIQPLFGCQTTLFFIRQNNTIFQSNLEMLDIAWTTRAAPLLQATHTNAFD